MHSLRKPFIHQLAFVVLTCVGFSLGILQVAGASELADVADRWSQKGWPLLETYCLDCHNEDNSEAEVNLSLLKTLDGVRDNGELAMQAISMIRFGAMPPEDADLPDSKERVELADRLDDLAYRSTCDLRPRPGRVTARRLNRAEYNNSIRDLFGMDLRPADQFPSDEVGAGFDNNADVLSLSPMLMDKYLSAAEFVASKVVVDPATLPNLSKTFADATLSVIGETKTGRFGQRYLESDGLAWIDVEIPVTGEYSIEFQASPSKDAKHQVLTSMHSRDGKLLAIFDNAHFEDRGRDDRSRTKLTLKQGKHQFFFRPTDIPESKREELEKTTWKLNEMVASRVAELAEDKIKASVLSPGTTLKADNDIDKKRFTFRVKSVVVRGPSEWTRDDLPVPQRKILRKFPSRSGDVYKNVEPAAKECLRPLISMAFRQPVTDEDVQPYAALVADATDRGDSFHRGMQIAMSAMLVSPRFLFRVEVPETDQARKAAGEGHAVALSSTQLASRMSYFLWSSLPDQSLQYAAKKNELDQSKHRLNHVRRMLADSKSESLGKQFVRQWFGLGNLDGRDLAEMNRSIGSTGLTADTLAKETEALFLHLLQENKPITDMLTADYTFANADLAKWYGVKGPKSDGFERVSLTKTSRRGVLGHAGILTLTSYPTRNSPVQRGKWILENVLGTPPPEAPPGVPELNETKASADATLREQLELHRADPGCASCHRVMDSLGFGLEDYDHFGRLRKPSDPARKDATGELPGGRKFQGAGELSRVLAKTESRRFAETAVRRLLTFAIGRELRPADRCFVESILQSTEKQGYRVRDLIEQVIESQPFLNHEFDNASSTTKTNREST